MNRNLCYLFTMYMLVYPDSSRLKLRISHRLLIFIISFSAPVLSASDRAFIATQTAMDRPSCDGLPDHQHQVP